VNARPQCLRHEDEWSAQQSSGNEHLHGLYESLHPVLRFFCCNSAHCSRYQAAYASVVKSKASLCEAGCTISLTPCECTNCSSWLTAGRRNVSVSLQCA
jgi:hypothetical protein